MISTGAALGFLAIVAFAFTCEAAIGFGAAVLTVTFASQLLSIDTIVASVLPPSLLLSARIAWCDRDAIDWPVFRRYVLAWMLPPLILSQVFLLGFRHEDPRAESWLKMVLGATVALLAGVELLRRAAPNQRSFARWQERGLLLGAGAMHGLFANGGPLLVYAVGRQLPEKKVFRATLSVTWLFLNSLLVAKMFLTGSLTVLTAKLSFASLASALVGLFLGQALHRRLEPAFFRRFVFGLLFLAGLSLLVRESACAAKGATAVAMGRAIAGGVQHPAQLDFAAVY